MSYLRQLKAKIAEKGLPDELPKLPEPGFVSFGSGSDSSFSKKSISVPPSLCPAAAAWLEQVRRLEGLAAPSSITTARWRQLLSDAAEVVIAWGDQAVALGWGEVDLFAVPPGPERWGRGGLVMALDGRPVIAMTELAATIQNANGKTTRYFRRPKPGSVLLWSAKAFDECGG